MRVDSKESFIQEPTSNHPPSSCQALIEMSFFINASTFFRLSQFFYALRDAFRHRVAGHRVGVFVEGSVLLPYVIDLENLTQLGIRVTI